MTIPVRWAYLAVFIGVCGHASSEFFAVLSGISGPEVSVWRYLIGGLGLVLWALARADSRDLISPLRAEGWRFVWLSLVGVSITYLAFHWALDFASVIQVATVVTTIPIFVGLSNLIINGQPLGMVKIITGAMAVLGVALLLTDGYLDSLTGEGSLFGVTLAVICAALGSAYAVLVKPIVARHGALRVTALSLMIGGVGLWLMVGAAWSIWVDPATLFERAPSEATKGVNPGWWILILAIWNTTITQLLWFGGLAAAPDITRASYLFFLKPVIAALLAILILAQDPTLLQILAILVVTGSVFVELFWPRLSSLFTRPAN
ncbi:MAG: DMT family transporter [Pseudomonadota bacterium]